MALETNLVLANLGGTLFAFCSQVCAHRYKAGQSPVTVHTGAGNGCWLCGRDLTNGSREKNLP